MPFVAKTSGVFRVPVSEEGIVPTALNIMLNNASKRDHAQVSVIVEKSANTFYPATSPLSFFVDQTVFLPLNETTKVVVFGITAEEFLNIRIVGHDHDIRGVLVYSFLADDFGHNLPSTVFKNTDYTMVHIH